MINDLEQRPRGDDWRPSNPRISVGGWIGSLLLAVLAAIVLLGLVGSVIHGNGSPFLGGV